MSESKSSLRRIQAAEKQCQALELRARGKTFLQIAEELGYKGKQAAYAAVKRAMGKLVLEPAEDLKKIDLERVDLAMTQVIPLIYLSGVHADIRLKAVDRLIKLIELRAKLCGYMAPLQLEHSGRVGHDVTFTKLPPREVTLDG